MHAIVACYWPTVGLLLMKSALPCLLGIGLFLSGCTMGPDYRPPEPALSLSWQARLPHDGKEAALLDWWGQFNDPVLTDLQKMAETDSPTLDAALAQIERARATLTSSRSTLFPNLDAGGTYSRARQLVAGIGVIGESRAGRLDAAWELDLFGKARRGAEAAEARIQARVDDWHDARISLAAEVADLYVQYRGCVLLAGAYEQQAGSQQSSIAMTRIAEDAGFIASGDLALSEAGAAQVRSAATQQRGACDLLVKGLVSLTGGTEPAIRTLLTQGQQDLPRPAGLAIQVLPADLIRQRPDLAAIEREVAATSAEIGAAVAAQLPSLSLAGSIGIAAAGSGGSGTTWSYGPTLSLPLFDAGRRAAAVTGAEAAYAQALANYRQKVRSVVLEVEQALVNLDTADRREGDAAQAAAGFERNFKAVDAAWQAGSASLLDREQARRNALEAEIALITLRQQQVRNWIALYKAAGGGWQAEGQS